MIAQARSGTRKIVAFAIPVLQSIDTTISETQAIILTSTRESATQIQSVLLALGAYMNMRCHAGNTWGTSIDEDIRQLEDGKHVVVGVPADVSDMIRNEILRTRHVKMLVLDEADELLGKDFVDFVHGTYRYLPPDIQSIVLGTTFSYDILRMTTKFMINPIRILVKHDDMILDGIKQYSVALDNDDWKLKTLVDLHGTLSVTQIVVFCYTGRKVST